MKKEKLTLQEGLAQRRIQIPPNGIYQILGFIWKLIFKKRLNVHYDYKIDVHKFKGPYIVVSNHASRVDYLYTGLAFYPHRMNYVGGYNEFFRSHLGFVLRLLQIIPKKNFTPEIYAIREIARLLRKGGRIVLFTEGMSSISGHNQPSAVGSGKLLKHFGVPVLYTMISGGYLTNTKYCLDERAGRVDVVIDQLFTPEQLKDMTEEEVSQKLDQAIRHDDYEWNKTARVAFDGHGEMAKNLHHLLYWCPRCHAELTMKGEGDVIRCAKCGNGATINAYYDLIPLDSACVIPDTQTKWFDLERLNAYQAVRDPGFKLAEPVTLGILPRHELLKNMKTAAVVGAGTLTLDHEGLHYRGTREGAAFAFDLSTDQFPTLILVTDCSFFATYSEGEYLEFIPSHEIVGKWLHCTEELHRFHGGKWKNFPAEEAWLAQESRPALVPVPLKADPKAKTAKKR